MTFRKSFAAWLTGALVLTPAVASALPPLYAGCPLPDVTPIRVTSIRQVQIGGLASDDFVIMFEFINWSEETATGLYLAPNVGFSNGVAFVDAGRESDGRPLDTPPGEVPNDDENFPPNDSNHFTPNQIFPAKTTPRENLWNYQGTFSPPPLRLQGAQFGCKLCSPPSTCSQVPVTFPTLQIPPIDVTAPSGGVDCDPVGTMPTLTPKVVSNVAQRTTLATHACSVLPPDLACSVDAGGTPQIPIGNLEGVDNARTPDNVLDGFWVKIHNWLPGTTFSFNWILFRTRTNTSGVGIGAAAIRESRGAGVSDDIQHPFSYGTFTMGRGSVTTSVFTGGNQLTTSNIFDRLADQFGIDVGATLAVDPGRLAPFADPASATLLDEGLDAADQTLVDTALQPGVVAALGPGQPPAPGGGGAGGAGGAGGTSGSGAAALPVLGADYPFGGALLLGTALTGLGVLLGRRLRRR